jgi:hypothetical protein
MPADTSYTPDRRHPVLDAWREAFVLELRSRDVSGARIGDALAEVDTHCAETGEHPEVSFGDPESYAADLADSLPVEDRTASVAPWGLVAGGLAIFLGVVLLLAGLGGLVEGHDAGYSYGSLVGLGLTAALSVVIVANLSRLLRPARRVALTALLVAGFLLPFIAGLMSPATVFTVPAWPCAGVGLVLVCVGGGVLSRGGPDLVVDPRTGSEALGTPRWVMKLGPALLPALLLLGVALFLGAVLAFALVPPGR